MALTVETGSGVANADSYITLADARTYATSRGLTNLGGADAATEIGLRKAFDYLESFRAVYKGQKTSDAQPNQWPRTYVFVDGVELAVDSIPTLLKNAQVYVADAILAGLDPLAVGTGEAFVVKEKVGPIETTYSEGVSTSGLPIIRKANVMLAPLLTTTGFLTTERA